MKYMVKLKKIKLLLLIFLATSLIFTAYQYQNIKFEKELNIMAVKQMEFDLVRLEHKLLMKEFRRLVSDVLIIKQTLEDDLEELESADRLGQLRRNFSIFINNKGIYDQIRYIDETGKEVVRVDLEDGEAVISKDDKLQNKSNRYYFKDTMETENGQVYISKLDLNVEHGEIEVPLKPMIRIAAKVFDKAGNEKGIVITNYYAKIMIDDFIDVANSNISSAYLLNDHTYWLANSADAASEFAFMYSDRQEVNFKNVHPLAYHEIFDNGKVYFETENDMYFAKKVVPFSDGENEKYSSENIVLGDGALTIVFHMQKDKVPNLFLDSFVDVIMAILEKNIAGFIALFIISILLTVLVHLYDKHKASLKYYSEIDQATEIFNRRAGLEKSLELINKTRSNGINAGIIFVDVNGLKSVNDNLGHQYGDELIKTAAKIMKDTIRQNDILFRYGGDEFIICLEKIDARGADILWNRILKNIEEFNRSKQYDFDISLSHGVSIILGEEKNVDIKKYIEEADHNMYIEKTSLKEAAQL